MAKPNVPQSLGDNEPSQFKLIRETHDLPKGRKEIVSKFEQVLSSGGVQKVVVQIGKPMAVDRLVKSNGLPDAPLETPEDDLIIAARNAPMEVLPFSEKSPFEQLYQAFKILSVQRLLPKAIIVHDLKAFSTWLGYPEDLVNEVFCVEIRTDPQIPDDASLLIGVSANETDLVVLSVRIEVNVPKPKKKERKS